MKKTASLLVLLLFFAPFYAFAQTYRWTDDEGVLHVTDDPARIPDKYWEQDRVKKEELKPTPPETKPAKPPQPPTAPREEKRELYGDYPIDWWIYKFREIRKNITDTQDTLEKEKNFVTVFEGGRGYGKIFTKDEIAQYDLFKADIPVLEEKMQKLKNDLEELQRKANIHGVPRNIRE